MVVTPFPSHIHPVPFFRQDRCETNEAFEIMGWFLLYHYVQAVPLPGSAIVIVLDVGKSVSTLHDYEEESFFKQAKDCILWIIQRKIISQSVDVLSLLLIGSNEPDGSSKVNAFQNISVKFDFQVASWDMLKFITSEIKLSKIESDWFQALLISMEMLKTYEEFNMVGNKKIVIFSDFAQPPSGDLDFIAEKIKASSVEVTIIGPDHLNLSSDIDDTEEPENKKRKFHKCQGRLEGERIIFNFWKKLPENIVICTFESALKQLCSFTPKTKRINYWNCTMDIGEVHINISMIKKTDPKQPKKFNTKTLKLSEEGLSKNLFSQDVMVKPEETTLTVRDTVMHYKHESQKSHDILEVEVKAEDTIEGFRYGTTIIPFSEEDKAVMEYKAGPKSFSVLGFTHISNVPYYLLSGECTYLVVPRDKDKNAEVALSAIIQAMKKMECLAIVRRVYFDQRGLSLGILYPTIEEIFCDETDDVFYREYLLFVELAFEDDLKPIDFPSLEHIANNITQNQYDAIDSLIDGMNLMKADKGLKGERCEAFDLPYLHDFKEQFFHYCVIQRGLNPDKPLPTSVPPNIKKFIEVPKSVEEKSKTAIKEIKKMFKIKKSWNNNSDNPLNNEGTSDQTDAFNKKQAEPKQKVEHFTDSVIERDPETTTRTWMKLFQKGFPTDEELEEIFLKLLGVSESELSENVRSFGIVISQIHAMYSDNKVSPDEYNRWMITFKKHLSGNNGIFCRFWEVIVNDYVGLITKQQNQYSKITDEEADEFLCATVNTSFAPAKEKPNLELLDELQEEQMNLDSAMF